MKVYLDIPYDQKDEIRNTATNQLFWDKERKKWYADIEPDEIVDSKLMKYIITYIKVSFKQKDEVKANGGKWDPVVKCWYWVNDPNHYFANSNFKHRAF